MAIKPKYDGEAILHDQMTGGYVILPRGEYRLSVGTDVLRANHVPLPIHEKRETSGLREFLRKLGGQNQELSAVLESLLLHNVGEHHALLYRREGETYIYDVSSFGTSLKRQGSKLYVSKTGWTRLKSGDEINFGGWPVDYHENPEMVLRILRNSSGSKRHNIKIA